MGKFRFKTKKGKEKLKILKCSENFTDTGHISGPSMEVFSNREIYIDGCKGILEYNDVYIKVRVSKGMIIISGSKLDVPSFEGPAISIKGKINSIELSIG